MKKFLSLLLSLAMLLSVAALADETHGNYSDEMKIPYAVDLSPEDGADSVERAGDHVDSPYFSRLDFYNMTSIDTLTILPHFQTMQQTSEWSCGVVSALMVMNWYGKLGDYNEQTLAQLRGTIGDKPGATSMSQWWISLTAWVDSTATPPSTRARKLRISSPSSTSSSSWRRAIPS